MAVPVLARAREVLRSGANPRDRHAAAKLLLKEFGDREAAVAAAGELARDPRCPDAIAVEAASLVLVATDRLNHQPRSAA